MTGPTVVVVGGSAGSLEALRALLDALPREAPIALVVCIHLLPTAPSLLPEVLAGYTGLAVHEARDKAAIAPGTILVAPPDYHLLVESPSAVALSRDAHHLFSRPSIDYLFESAADALGARAVGVLLSGANVDGAEGLRAIRKAGGRVAAQDPKTASAPEMPAAGIAAASPDLVADPRAIGAWLAQMLMPEKSR